MIGQTLGHYRIVAKLGEGGMGVVYRVEDTALRRPVTVKLVSEGSTTSASAHARFLREARTVAAVNHPAICTIYEVGEVPAEGDPLIGDSGQPTWARRPTCRRSRRWAEPRGDAIYYLQAGALWKIPVAPDGGRP